MQRFLPFKLIFLFVIFSLLLNFNMIIFAQAPQDKPYAEPLWYYMVQNPTNCQQNVTPIGDPNSTCMDFDLQPVLGDVDHDGLPEVVFIRCGEVNVIKDVNFDGGLADIIWHYDVGWGKDTSYIPPPFAEVADMNNDGLLEIVSQTPGGFVVLQPWDQQGNKLDDPVLWRFSWPRGGSFADHFSIGDINNDGFPDVVMIVANRDQNIISVYAAGGQEKTLLWSYTTSGRLNLWYPPTLYDIDGDGVLDVVIGYDTTVEVLKVYPNTTPISLMKWVGPDPQNTVIRGGAAIADLDNNGSPEIIIRRGPIAAPSEIPVIVHALTINNGQLAPFWEYTQPDNGTLQTELALGDIDNDGQKMEVLGASRNFLFILNAQGKEVWKTDHDTSYEVSPALADLDNDGDLEIAIGGYYHPHRFRIFNPILNPAGNFAPVYEYISQDNSSSFANSSPVIGDTNGDGTLEVVYDMQEHFNCAAGTLRAFKTNHSAVNPGEVVWGTIRANNHKTGLGQHGHLKPRNLPIFQRGDANADGLVNISDAIFLLRHLFAGDEQPSCLDAADFDNNTKLEITDAVYLLNHLFLAGPALPDPFGKCGTDTESLGCTNYPSTACPVQ